VMTGSGVTIGLVLGFSAPDEPAVPARCARTARPGIGFPAPAGGYPAGQVPRPPGPAGVPPAVRERARCPVVTWLPGWRLRPP
jgi:hypothetical protein